MSEEYTDPAAESDMRRRAAWLLGMLVLVAVLLVALMVVFLSSGGGGGNQAAPTGPALPTGPTSTSPGSHSTSTKSGTSGSPSGQSSSTGVHQPKHVAHHQVSCPSQLPCVAQGDVGNAVAAINAYRRQHGVPAVNGRVSNAAQQCALTNGSDCTGSWAESQVAAPDGKAALQKVLPFAHSLLAPQLSSLEVGWAYDPAAKQYYFALIQNA